MQNSTSTAYKTYFWQAHLLMSPNFSYLCTYDLYGPVRNGLMRADPLLEQVGVGWVLEIAFLGPVK